jgi:hypothetical protein
MSISKKVLMDTLSRAAMLYRQGAGVPISVDHDYDTSWEPEHGLVDEIHPEMYDLNYWANNVLLFLRTIYGIWKHAADNDVQPLPMIEDELKMD